MQYIAGITIAIFLIFLLVFKRKNKADWVLVCWLLTLTIHTGLYYLDTSATIDSYSFLIGLSIPFPLLHGPFLYIYASLLLNPNTSISSYWKHFIPYLLVNLTLIPFYSLPASDKLYIFQNDGVGYETFVLVNTILIFLSGVIYFAVSYKLLSKHKKSSKNNLSQIEENNLNWLRFLTIGMGIIWLFVFYGNNELIFSGVALFIILIGLVGIRQNTIFSNIQVVIDKNQLLSKNVKYEKSGLDNKRKAALVKRLEQLILNEKPFLNPELSLKELSQKIDTQQNYLSQILNEHFGMNFYDFINSKRVDEFCAKINNNELQHYKLIEIATACGFNSKSAFNRNFKRFTGKTPSEYKKVAQDGASGKITPQLDEL